MPQRPKKSYLLQNDVSFVFSANGVVCDTKNNGWEVMSVAIESTGFSGHITFTPDTATDPPHELDYVRIIGALDPTGAAIQQVRVSARSRRYEFRPPDTNHKFVEWDFQPGIPPLMIAVHVKRIP